MKKIVTTTLAVLISFTAMSQDAVPLKINSTYISLSIFKNSRLVQGKTIELSSANGEYRLNIEDVNSYLLTSYNKQTNLFVFKLDENVMRKKDYDAVPISNRIVKLTYKQLDRNLFTLYDNETNIYFAIKK